MDVSSVSNSSPSSSVTAPRRVEQAPKPESKATREPNPDEVAARKAEQPKRPAPVVNTQGQTTGRILNTTA